MLRFRWLASAILLVGLVFVANAFGRDLDALALRLPGIDKVLHFTAYAALFVCFRAVTAQLFASSHRTTAIAWGIGLLMSVADESIQSLFPARNVEFADLRGRLGRPCHRLGAQLDVRPPGRTRARRQSLDSRLRDERFLFPVAGLRDRFAVPSAGTTSSVQGMYYLKALHAGVDTPGFYNGLAWVELESGVGDPDCRGALRRARAGAASDGSGRPGHVWMGVAPCRTSWRGAQISAARVRWKAGHVLHSLPPWRCLRVSFSARQSTRAFLQAAAAAPSIARSPSRRGNASPIC